jgi:hypothetical protein
VFRIPVLLCFGFGILFGFELQGGTPIQITNLGLCLCPNLQALVKVKHLLLKLNFGNPMGILLDTNTLRLTLRFVLLDQTLSIYIHFKCELLLFVEIIFHSNYVGERASKLFSFRVED